MKTTVVFCTILASSLALADGEQTPTNAVPGNRGPTATALASAIQARTPEEQAAQQGFQLQGALDHALGLGTFVDASRYARLIGSLTVAPTYLFSVRGQRLVASGTFRLGFEYTLPAASTGRRTQVSDVRLGLAAPVLFKEPLTGISFSPGASLAIPTSLESWHAGLITNLGLSATASRSLGPFDLRLTVGGSRGFFTSAQNGVAASTATDATGNLLVPSRNGEPVSAFANWNQAWSFSLGGQVQWRATGSLLFYAGYTFTKSWRYAATLTVDEYTPQGLDANGNPVAKVGLGQADRTAAFVGASYQLTSHFTLDLGLSTVQAPLTATGQVRFPFLSIGSWADNASSIYFTLGAAY